MIKECFKKLETFEKDEKKLDNNISEESIKQNQLSKDLNKKISEFQGWSVSANEEKNLLSGKTGAIVKEIESHTKTQVSVWNSAKEGYLKEKNANWLRNLENKAKEMEIYNDDAITAIRKANE